LAVIALLLIACSNEPEPKERMAPTLEEVLRGEARSNDVAPIIGGAESVPVNLRFNGISPLYMGYFSDPSFVAPLGTALGSCASDGLDVVLSYDDDIKTGTVVVSVGPRDLSCRPTQDMANWDLKPLLPVAKALADYRDAIAAQRDFRVASFRTGVAYMRGTNMCTLYLGGQYPPDGSSFSPCVDFAGVPHCTTLEDIGITTFRFVDDEDQAYFTTCLGG
jgi:hypothetical protein